MSAPTKKPSLTKELTSFLNDELERLYNLVEKVADSNPDLIKWATARITEIQNTILGIEVPVPPTFSPAPQNLPIMDDMSDASPLEDEATTPAGTILAVSNGNHDQ
jgi:hypothetical protein